MSNNFHTGGYIFCLLRRVIKVYALRIVNEVKESSSFITKIYPFFIKETRKNIFTRLQRLGVLRSYDMGETGVTLHHLSDEEELQGSKLQVNEKNA